MIESYRFDVVFIGDYSVGKTALFTRYIDGAFNTAEYYFNCKQATNRRTLINENNIEFNIWDVNKTEDEHEKSEQSKLRLRCFDGIILVFDITNEVSFEIIQQWLTQVCEHHSLPVNILVGNKLDLLEEKVVDLSRAKAYADKLNMPFVGKRSTSAKSGQNVEQVFKILAEQMKRKREQEYCLKKQQRQRRQQQQNRQPWSLKKTPQLGTSCLQIANICNHKADTNSHQHQKSKCKKQEPFLCYFCAEQ
ncbi:unnamed protein product [Didymodactylos carnosus]|uniref:Uncharacterized protein n=1 Tax=Didymodactylos carnosus TaxID=1234261 RepID=A0A814BNV2_9BILA|nr:unnamed protein product [Didymodactylos carnosus]CAF0929259.1 unnamed protein product [Didymodactylos carnosus]CAF3525127.1 unnamed protein product [Didymodactylos carnosus]CAF3707431.1 unnamed protein product [Didymodactylos carnosus]